MSEELPNQHSPNTTASDKGGDNIKNGFPPDNRNLVLKSVFWIGAEIISLGAVATGLWIVGEHLVNNGYSIGAWVNYLAAVMFSCTVVLPLLKLTKRPKIIWPVWIVFCLILALAWAWIGRHAETQPHFKLWLAMSDRPDDVVLLTNSPSEKFDSSGKSPILVIPRIEGQTNFSIRFVMQNDSTIMAENVEFAVEFSEEFSCKYDDAWSEFRRVEPVPTLAHRKDPARADVLRGAVITPPAPIMPKSGIALPFINLSCDAKDCEVCNFYLLSWTKASPHPETLDFSVVFVLPSPTAPDKPTWGTVKHTTNGVFEIRRSIERMRPINVY